MKNKSVYYILVPSFFLFAWILWETYQANNFGFSSKTFWDWMELLLVPVALTIAGYWFARVQKNTELEIARRERETDRAIAQDRQMQQTFEYYIGGMKELLLEKGLGQEAEPEVRRLARTLTLNVIRELSAERNQLVFQFLQESGLFGDGNTISLKDANLSNVDLSGADLRSLDLSGVELIESILIGADLSGANLRHTNLYGADLRGANLQGIKAYCTKLTRANLKGASLLHADLSRSFVEGADMRALITNETNLEETYYNEYTTWPDDFDPKLKGMRLRPASYSSLVIKVSEGGKEVFEEMPESQ